MTNTLYYVYNPETLYVLKKADGCRAITTKRSAAVRILNSNIKKGKAEPGKYVIGTESEYRAADSFIEVVSLLTGKHVRILKSTRGSVCDPSTETHWAM